MMYCYYNCKPSIPYRYILILLRMDGDRERLFDQVVAHTGVNSVDNVCISIYTLYTSLGDLSGFDSERVKFFLDIVVSCLKRTKSKKLNEAVDDILLPLVANSEFREHFKRFAQLDNALNSGTLAFTDGPVREPGGM